MNVNKLIAMPPCVSEEHRQVLEDAETTLADYTELLVAKANKNLFEFRPNIDPHPNDIRDIELQILNDPIRSQMIINLARLKLLVEIPRFLVSSGQTNCAKLQPNR